MKYFLTIMVALICITIDIGIVIFFIGEVDKTFSNFVSFAIASFGLIFLTLATWLFWKFIDDCILETWIDNY